LNRIIVVIILVTTLSLLFAPSLANGEIKVTPPTNWQPDPDNNPDRMWWYQKPTKSTFAINKDPANVSFPLFPVGPIMAQSFADQGILESVDQVTFGHSNYGYRYFLNLTSPSKLAISSYGSAQPGSILDLLDKSYDVPYKGMLILTEKQSDLYAIVLLSPKENFDSIFNQIKPTLDSIHLSNSTE
jgi:hypothetical protein